LVSNGDFFPVGDRVGGYRRKGHTVEEKRALILVADDDTDVCSILGMVLKRKGHQVLEAYDGLEAWEIIKSKRPAVVLLDIMMPGMSGLELCRKIRETTGISKTPVIMISALTARNEILQGFQAGANDYITKPFVSVEVLARVRSALRQWQLREEKVRGEELRSFGEQLDHILVELDAPLVQLMRQTKRLREITASMDEEKTVGNVVHQHGMRAYLIMQELRSKKEEIHKRLVKKG
jgi:PleD family two-component response regulator